MHNDFSCMHTVVRGTCVASVDGITACAAGPRWESRRAGERVGGVAGGPDHGVCSSEQGQADRAGVLVAQVGVARDVGLWPAIYDSLGSGGGGGTVGWWRGGGNYDPPELAARHHCEWC